MAMRSSSRAGFTLVELMIALIAGAFAVSAVYYLNGVSARAFAEQMRVSETQMSLRSAMEQLRRDFSRAGYLGTANSALIPDCSGTAPSATTQIAPFALRALNITRDASLTGAVATMLATATNRTRADTVDVWGNYATADTYLVDPNRSTDTTIFFQDQSEAFRRSFYDPAAANAAATWSANSQARFAAAFAQGRMLRVENDGRVFFRTIQSSNGTTVGAQSVTLSSALPSCFRPSTWAAASPIVHLQYAVESDATADLVRLQSTATAAGTGVPGARRTILTRREWTDAAGASTVVPNSSRIVLDYAVEFGVDTITNTNLTTSATSPPTWAFTRSLTTGTVNPHLVRSLIVTLTARSAEASPRLQGLVRTPFDVNNVFDGPMMMFRVIDPASPALVLNARVRTLRSEILLQNQ
jgi:prepilin-type N-terminal cleavage/methylation domain-containing protein